MYISWRESKRQFLVFVFSQKDNKKPNLESNSVVFRQAGGDSDSLVFFTYSVSMTSTAVRGHVAGTTASAAGHLA